MQEYLDDAAFEFFKLFASYESILKERGFFITDQRGRIFVDWDRFANEVIGPNFQEKLEGAGEYILAAPPMKQGVNNSGDIVWKEVSDKDKSVQALFGHLCRIRNNLFHGAKFNGTWFDPERSNLLLRDGIDVLTRLSPWLGRYD